MFQLVFYVPETHVEPVKEALFAAGAGRIGDYVRCAWQVLGQGQFEPSAGSQPFLGEQGRLEALPEYRVEMVCDDACIATALEALLAAHPYEEPAYHCWSVDSASPAGEHD
jgi:hypothetical protein